MATYNCTSPLYRVSIGSSNFPKLLPCDSKRLRNHGVIFSYDKIESYFKVSGWDNSQVQKIRCGQCLSCRLAYARDWAVRCSLEASLHRFNYFITLTYDDFHLPKGEYIDATGVVYDSTLCRRHVQLFLKNLREWERTENGNTGIKVFYCGEYGDQTSRPHYHLCLFGVSEIPDLKFFCKRGNFNYFKSQKYEKFWSDKVEGIDVPRGFVDISECTFDTCAYTARYIVKKQKGLINKDFFESYYSLDPLLRPELRVQPFVGMSNRPGIASDYYKNNRDQIYSEDLVKYYKKYDLFKAKPPRYFDKLYDHDFPESFDRLRFRRSMLAQHTDQLKRYLVSESIFSRLKREDAMVNDLYRRKNVRSL